MEDNEREDSLSSEREKKNQRLTRALVSGLDWWVGLEGKRGATPDRAHFDAGCTLAADKAPGPTAKRPETLLPRRGSTRSPVNKYYFIYS